MVLKEELSTVESVFCGAFIGSSYEPGTVNFLCNLGNQ